MAGNEGSRAVLLRCELGHDVPLAQSPLLAFSMLVMRSRRRGRRGLSSTAAAFVAAAGATAGLVRGAVAGEAFRIEAFTLAEFEAELSAPGPATVPIAASEGCAEPA